MALKMQKGHQKFQISNCKVDKSWGGNAKSMAMTVNKVVLYIYKLLRVDLQSSYPRKINFVTMYVNQTFGAGHFATYTNIETLGYTPRTNTMSIVFQ